MILSTITSSSTLFTTVDITFWIGYPKSTHIEQLANLLEQFCIERLKERFLEQFTDTPISTLPKSDQLYTQIKSITLHLTKNKI